LINVPPDFATHFSLNAGLNVARVTDGGGKPIDFAGWYKPGVDGEARVYEVDTPAPEKLCIQYVGAYPAYPAHDGPNDFKGWIAFNGDSMRATEQAAWLPTPYDATAKRRLSGTSYDLDIKCDDCRFIYMSGSAPATQSSAHFASPIAYPPLLFVGNGPITKAPGVTIVNEQLSDRQTAALSGLFVRIGTFYRTYLGRPIGDTPTLLRMLTIDQAYRDRKGSSWGFATWPTIALSGTVAGLGDALITPTDANAYVTPYLAHETAHYYFGTLNSPSGPYRWFLLESMAEFLAIKAQMALSGIPAANRRLAGLANNLGKNGPFVALDAIGDEAQITDVYRYRYAPMLLLALDRQIGEKRMQAFVRALLMAPSPKSWADLQAIAFSAGMDRKAWEMWRAKCVTGGTLACADPTLFAPSTSKS
jgi:hypothetical protein